MAPLTLADIERIEALAKSLGMADYEAEGVKLALLQRAAKPGIGDRLRLSIEQLEAEQAATINAYVEDAAAIGRDLLGRGRAALEAISDDEWEQLIAEGD